ncbi:MAG: SCO family protein [Pirellulales bacterium]
MNNQKQVNSDPAHDITENGPPKDVQVQPFELIDTQGKPYDFSQLEDQVWVASFFFSTCPATCRQQNEKVAELQEMYADQGVKFISITCDPDTDTPETLASYAKAFGAKQESWAFLTGEMETIEKIATKNFKVSFAKKTHSDRLIVIDSNGKLRDTFHAIQPVEFSAANKLIATLLKEKAEALVEVASEEPEIPTEQKMFEFELMERSRVPFKSTSLEGKYWLGSFFFTTCPHICFIQNTEIAKLQTEYGNRDLTFVSITCDPDNDTTETLSVYADRFGAKKDVWYFCTGDYDDIEKIGHDYFNIRVEHKVHSDRVFLVGPEGKVLDSFRTREEKQMIRLREMLDELLPTTEESASTETE